MVIAALVAVAAAAARADSFDHFFVPPKAAASALACPLKRELQVRFDPRRSPATVQWRRCPPSARQDDDSDWLFVNRAGVPLLALDLTQPDDGGWVSRLLELSWDQQGGRQVFVLVDYRGSAGHHDWCVLAERRGRIGCLRRPNLDGAAARVLQPGEELGCHGWREELTERGLRLQRPIFRTADGDCSHGRGHVELVLGMAGGRLKLLRAVRHDRDLE